MRSHAGTTSSMFDSEGGGGGMNAYSRGKGGGGGWGGGGGCLLTPYTFRVGTYLSSQRR